MKSYATLAAIALLAAPAVQAETLKPSKYQETAQTTTDSMSTTASPMQDNISNEKVKEPANLKGGSFDNGFSNDFDTGEQPPAAKAGDIITADTATMGSTVKVKLADGKIISVPDSADSPWNRSEQLKGYDRFTFDPVNNVFVAGKGDKEFESNWDENGNRIRKVVKAAAKKVEVQADDTATTETTTETTTEETTTEPTTSEEPAPAAQ